MKGRTGGRAVIARPVEPEAIPSSVGEVIARGAQCPEAIPLGVRGAFLYLAADGHPALLNRS
jgi:hypothetical protein